MSLSALSIVSFSFHFFIFFIIVSTIIFYLLNSKFLLNRLITKISIFVLFLFLKISLALITFELLKKTDESEGIFLSML